VRVCDLDPATLGMEFVLSLEAPCLGHLHGNPSKPHEPTGHALTTSTQIECMSNYTPPSGAHPATLSTVEVPTKILEHLLNLSSCICSEDELTPTQAWNNIRQAPHFGGLEVQDLRILAKKPRERIKCHGYVAQDEALT
ncbi:hypothetical protein B0O99DRAFT_528509, partial [Bisporella sp. PMI_857]